MDIEQHICNLDAVPEVHAVVLQVADHRKNHRFILVVLRETKGREVRKSADVVDIALHVALHFKRALVVLEREHRAPVHPEIRIENFIVEDIRDLYVRQIFVRGHKELHDLETSLVGKAE